MPLENPHRRPVFAIWMRLLEQVPGSVLWLKQPGEGKANLVAAAKTAGIDPSRLIFAGTAALPRHLARHQLADLFSTPCPITPMPRVATPCGRACHF